MTKRKICLVTTSPLIIHFFLKNVIRRLSENFDVTIILCKDDDFILLNDLENYVTFKFIKITRSINIFRDIQALLQLFFIFYFNRYDVVHTIAPKAGLLGQIAAFLNRVDVRVHTFQGEVWVNMRGLARLLLKSLDWVSAVLATHLIVVSESEKKFLIQEKVISNKKALVLGAGSISGIDFNYHHKSSAMRDHLRSQLGYEENDFVFLYVGRLNLDKGIDILLNAFDVIARRYSLVYLLVVGRDEESWDSEFKKHEFFSKIRYLGFKQDPRNYYQIADIICLPSRREGFGMVLLEAAAYGVPSLATRIYGIVDAVVEGKSGLLFEHKDELVSHMEEMINNVSLRVEMGDYAFNRTKTFFDQEIFISQYNRFYLTACGARGS